MCCEIGRLEEWKSKLRIKAFCKSYIALNIFIKCWVHFLKLLIFLIFFFKSLLESFFYLKKKKNYFDECKSFLVKYSLYESTEIPVLFVSWVAKIKVSKITCINMRGVKLYKLIMCYKRLSCFEIGSDFCWG